MTTIDYIVVGAFLVGLLIYMLYLSGPRKGRDSLSHKHLP